MVRRRRDKAKSFEEQVADATLELEQAESALRYRRSQLGSAKDDLSSLSGVAGWIPALLGRRDTYRDEAEAKIKALNTEILGCRRRLIEARQVRARLQTKQDRQRATALERDDQLERFASRVHQSSHPLKERLQAIDTQLEAITEEIATQDAAAQACLGLRASMAEILYRAGRMKSAALWNVFGSDTFVDLHSTKRANDKLLEIPTAVRAFNDACLPLGLAPLDLEFPEISFGWSHILIGEHHTRNHRAREVLGFCDQLDNVADIVQQTTLWVTGKRAESQGRYEALLQERRALLDDALG